MIGVASLSDHAPLRLSLAFPPHAPIAKCWCLNTGLLAYKDTLAEIEVAITQYLLANDTPEVSAATLWEALKAVIRGQFIATSARLNKARQIKWQQLEDQIRTLETTHSVSGSLEMRRQIATLRKQLRTMGGDRAEYALLRTKQKYYTGGDRTGRLLAQQLQAQTAGRRVAELQLPDGTQTCGDEQIVTQFEHFYSDLSAAEGLDAEGPRLAAQAVRAFRFAQAACHTISRGFGGSVTRFGALLMKARGRGTGYALNGWSRWELCFMRAAPSASDHAPSSTIKLMAPCWCRC
ncbi:hypothetical protein NDU88_004424 [Pleurodeles waltl]|uniref:Uncharacterized protein n=1 Tax=Pleurodeles waltl TaxID=8319 RepID=A0AAV7SIR0_PLEWA|nr:hypothetical protein NDU88_004424 [Pleurodeles waltl]